MAWLDTERDNLIATAASAAGQGRHDHILHQSATLHHHLYSNARFAHAMILHKHSLAAARATGCHSAELRTLLQISNILHKQGLTRQATDCYGKAVRIARNINDHAGELRALVGLGDIDVLQARDGMGWPLPTSHTHWTLAEIPKIAEASCTRCSVLAMPTGQGAGTELPRITSRERFS